MYSASGNFALLCTAMLATGMRHALAASPDLLDLTLDQLLRIEVAAKPRRSPAPSLVPPAGAAAGDSSNRNYQAIAAALLNLTRFIEWPADPDGDFRLCIAGPDPFGPGLETLANRSVHARPIRIEHQVEEAGACQLVFVPSGNRLPPPAVGRLLVAEDAHALSRGAAIVIGVDGSRVIFDINPNAASRAGLKISYKLLRLARSSPMGTAAKAARTIGEGR